MVSNCHKYSNNIYIVTHKTLKNINNIDIGPTLSIGEANFTNSR